MIAIIMSICASIISGMVLFFLQRFFKKKQKVDEERDRAKAKENMLILKSIDAVGKLTYADAVAIRDGKTNGEMKEAMKDFAGGYATEAQTAQEIRTVYEKSGYVLDPHTAVASCVYHTWKSRIIRPHRPSSHRPQVRSNLQEAS